MPFLYRQAVKVFVLSVLLCGVTYVVGYHALAGYMLMMVGLIGMIVTTGSALGYIKVIGSDGKVIPPARKVSHPYGR